MKKLIRSFAYWLLDTIQFNDKALVLDTDIAPEVWEEATKKQALRIFLCTNVSGKERQVLVGDMRATKFSAKEIHGKIYLK